MRPPSLIANRIPIFKYIYLYILSNLKNALLYNHYVSIKFAHIFLSLTSMYHITISNYRCAFSPCTLIYCCCLAYLTIPSLNLSASTFAGRIAPLPRSTSSSHAASSRQDSVVCASC